MAGVSVNIKPEIIKWILHVIQFEDVTDATIEILNKWQAGEKIPTFNQIEDMSRKTNIPFGYFFLDKPPIEKYSIVDYRTINSVNITEPSRELMEIVDLMTDIQEWMVEYVIENGQEELEYVGSIENTTNIQVAVNDIRKRLEIDIDWYANTKNIGEAFRFLKKKIENVNVLVMISGIVGNNTHRKLNIDEFRAFTLVNKYVPLIFINSCDSETGKIFSIVHELVHVWIGENSFYNVPMDVNNISHRTEQYCNSVEAELLIPTEKFLEKWEENNKEEIDKIDTIAKSFRCSKYVVVRKALDNKKINQSTYEQIVTKLRKEFIEWKKKHKENKSIGGDYYRNLASKIDKRFIMALARSASEGKVQYTEVYRLTNTNRKTFEKLLDEMGGVN